jgi:hypothetical protein
MQVQLVGVPTSGKTTISRRLINLYPEQYCMVEKDHQSFSKFILKQPVFAFRVILKCSPILTLIIKYVRRSEVNRKGQFLAIAGLILNLANFLTAKKKTALIEKIVIWDEMLLQRGLSIFAYSRIQPQREDLKRYYNWAAKTSDVLPVFMHCDDNTIFKRIEDRGVPKRMSTMSNALVKAIMKNQIWTLSELQNFSDETLIMRSGEDIENDLEKLHLKLSALYVK